MRYLVVGLSATLTALWSGSAFAEGETIAVFTKNLTNPYFQAVRIGTETAAKTLGVKVIQYVPTKPDSIPEQLSQVEDGQIALSLFLHPLLAAYCSHHLQRLRANVIGLQQPVVALGKLVEVGRFRQQILVSAHRVCR